MHDLDILSVLTLAQDGGAGLPGETAAAPSSGTGGAPGGRPDPFGGMFMPIMLGMIVLMIVVSTLGPRKEKKRREAMTAALRKHDRVQTVGGIIGSVADIRGDLVVLKVDESSNTRITFAKSAIQQVLESPSAATGADASPSAA